MIILASAAAITLALAGAPAMDRAAPPSDDSAVAAVPSPLAGNWSLDISKIPESERPRRVTISFRQNGDATWTTHVEIVGPDGSTMHADSTAATDGVPVRIATDIPSFNTVALRQPSPDTLVMTLGNGDVPVSTRVYSVSKDRRTMTETIIWAGGSLPMLETTTFQRVG